MSDIIRIEPGSAAFEMLTEMMNRPGAPRAISVTKAGGGVQLKWGGGTWTTPLSAINLANRPENDDVRKFTVASCGHDVCDRCGGHKSFEESDRDHFEAPNGWSVLVHKHSCFCCKHCGRPGGH